MNEQDKNEQNQPENSHNDRKSENITAKPEGKN